MRVKVFRIFLKIAVIVNIIAIIAFAHFVNQQEAIDMGMHGVLAASYILNMIIAVILFFGFIALINWMLQPLVYWIWGIKEN